MLTIYWNLLRDMYGKRILFSVLNLEFICTELCLCCGSRARMRASDDYLSSTKHIAVAEEMIFLGIPHRERKNSIFPAVKWRVIIVGYTYQSQLRPLYRTKPTDESKKYSPKLTTFSHKTLSYNLRSQATNQRDFVNDFIRDICGNVEKLCCHNDNATSFALSCFWCVCVPFIYLLKSFRYFNRLCAASIVLHCRNSHFTVSTTV